MMQFLEQVHIFYEQTGKNSRLYLDLMQLSVDGLRKISTDDRKKLHSFLRKKMTKGTIESIVDEISLFMVRKTID